MVGSWYKYEKLAAFRKTFLTTQRRFLRRARDTLWPPRSIATGEVLVGPGQLEPEIWSRLTFILGPICNLCGQPLDPVLEQHVDDMGAVQCGGCHASRPVFAKARSALIYDDVSRDLVLRLKHGGDQTGIHLMAGWMAQAAPDIVSAADLIVPVPLHYTRLQKRGFNQSLRLAAVLSRLTSTRLSAHGLKRIKATPSQAGRSADGRKRNVSGAFEVSHRDAGRIAESHILLIDDVFTTGATVEACARVLKRAGARETSVLTLARVAGLLDGTI